MILKEKKTNDAFCGKICASSADKRTKIKSCNS